MVMHGDCACHQEYVISGMEQAMESGSDVDALAEQRAENQRLRLALRGYANALRTELDRHGSLQTIESYDQLKEKLKASAVLGKLNDLTTQTDGESSSAVRSEEVIVTADAEFPNGWLLVDEEDFFGSEVKEVEEGLDAEGYVYVTQDDFVDGIANFLVKYLSLIPEAKQMSPQDLRKAVLKAFTQSDDNGRMRKLWETAKTMYVATSWGTTVFGLCRNPIVLQAASTAVLTTCSLILAVLT